MKAAILAAFEGRIGSNCLIDVSSPLFAILDPASEDGDIQAPIIVVFPPSEGHFIVENPSEKPLTVLAIDHCIHFEKGKQPCDFAIFDDALFCFADIKNVKRKNRNAARSEARNQLYSSIQVFKEKIDFVSYQIRAIIVFTFKQSYPIAKVATQDAKIRFEDELNSDLFEGNSITF